MITKPQQRLQEKKTKNKNIYYNNISTKTINSYVEYKSRYFRRY